MVRDNEEVVASQCLQKFHLLKLFNISLTRCKYPMLLSFWAIN